MDVAELMAAWPSCERSLRKQAWTYWALPADVDDAVQEVFVRVYPKRHRIEGVRRLRAYLRVTLRYYWVDWYRTQAARATYQASQAHDPEPYLPPDAGRRVLLREVQDAIDNLRPTDQARLRSYWSNESLAETSRKTGVPTTTLSERRRAAVKRLRRRLQYSGST